jgi:hypothetical protein
MSNRPHPVSAADDHAAERPLATGVGLHSRSAGRTTETPHSHKFLIATVLLVALAVVAVVVAIAVASSGSNSITSASWSDWKPSDDGALGAREIADHVAPFYRISGVDQLAVVTVTNINSSAASSSAASSGATASTGGNGLQVAVRTDPSSSSVSVLSGNTIAYNLCGIGGQNCAIGVGKASSARLLLLRREALELALYTFKYISSTDNVVAMLPPGHQAQTSRLTPKPPSSNASAAPTPVTIALLFLHQELKPWLDQPLSNTLPEQFPPLVGQMTAAPEAPLVDQLTARGLFSERLVQAQDGSNLIVLNPLPPQ